ncbi:uncharacterized protein [Macrobrachium rosenbergii]|uniref:uncharacterized protein n=1 Tax=Macrobrachium rosenbergii TaxID=79674 RepID=UPI0034D6773A
MSFTLPVLGMLLLRISCTSAATSEYEVKMTLRGKSALFNLPRIDQVLFGYRKNASTASYRLNLFTDGIRVYYGSGNMTLLGQEWRLFWITRKEIVGPTLHTSIPKMHRILRGRSLQISSKEKIEWQMFTLPLKQNDSLRTTSGWEEETFDLPESETVFLGLRKTEHEVSEFHLHYFDDVNSVGQNFSALPWDGWTFIRISRYVIYPQVASGHLEIPNPSQSLQRRRIVVSSRDFVQWQMFAFPLQYADSSESKKLDSMNEIGDTQGDNCTEQEYTPSAIAIMAILCGVLLVIAMILRGYIGYLKRHGGVKDKDFKEKERRHR